MSVSTISRRLRRNVCAAASIAALCSGFGAAPALAQSSNVGDGALSDIVRRALAASPDVAARLNALRAADDATDAVSAGRMPRVDLDAAVGRTRDVITTRNPEGQSLSHHGVAVSVTQLLWDGGAISGDVSRLGHERQARWFELVDASEQVALDTVRAVHDVQRFRELVAQAEDNYVQHKVIAQQVNNRVQAGVGRGVDLEQATARLALADANLATETANLHDVAARFLRVAGEVPPASLPKATSLGTSLPASAADATTAAVRNSAALSASIEAMRAARDGVRTRESAYYPKIEARVRSGAGRNFDGVPDQKRDTSAQIALNWNLYEGGASQARVRQGARLVEQAGDQRDSICRDVRQTAAIAYNDVRKLGDVIVVLERNTASIVKARDAYRQQFDIGQRNLLDLLNAENEVYTARRALANARGDLAVAQARALAAMQQLNSKLGITRPTEAGPAPEAWEAGADAPGRCPDTVVAMQNTRSRADLDTRASNLVSDLMKAAPQPVVAPSVPTAVPLVPAEAHTAPARSQRKR